MSTKKSTLFYEKFCIDSFKLSIDTSCFVKVNIPENFILVCTDTGEEITEFKKNSLKIPYKSTSIYVGIIRRNLKGHTYEKLTIIFSSKVAGTEYFYGIRKHHILEVLRFLKSKRYLIFYDIEALYSNIYTKDVDIKRDFFLEPEDRDKIVIYNKELKERFQYEDCELHIYKSKDNFGIQTFNRERSTLTRPFLKFYDKNTELLKKHPEFFATLAHSIKVETFSKFIYRFEFTMKDKKFFSKFGLTNKIQDVLEVTEEKWKEIARYFINVNFQEKVKRIKSGKLNYIEKVLAFYFFNDVQKYNLKPRSIKNKYTSIQETRQQKQRAAEMFDKIYASVVKESGKMCAMRDNYEIISKFDAVFDLFD